MIVVLINLIRVISRILILIIFADVIVSYFLSPYHKVRMTLDRIAQPLLSPIRKYLPPMGGFDFSPLVLLIAVQIVEYLLIRLVLLLS